MIASNRGPGGKIDAGRRRSAVAVHHGGTPAARVASLCLRPQSHEELLLVERQPLERLRHDVSMLGIGPRSSPPGEQRHRHHQRDQGPSQRGATAPNVSLRAHVSTHGCLHGLFGESDQVHD